MDPELYFNQLGSSRFWPNLIRRSNAGWNRIRELNLTRQQTRDFVERNRAEFSTLLLKQFFPDIVSGTLTISADRIYAELVHGAMADLAHSKINPELRMWRDELAGLFKFDDKVGDEKLRQILWQTLQLVPHENSDSEIESRGASYFSGYYEFQWTWANDIDSDKSPESWNGEPLKPFFLDYQNSKPFLVSSESVL